MARAFTVRVHRMRRLKDADYRLLCGYDNKLGDKAEVADDAVLRG